MENDKKFGKMDLFCRIQMQSYIHFYVFQIVQGICLHKFDLGSVSSVNLLQVSRRNSCSNVDFDCKISRFRFLVPTFCVYIGTGGIPANSVTWCYFLVKLNLKLHPFGLNLRYSYVIAYLNHQRNTLQMLMLIVSVSHAVLFI